MNPTKRLPAATLLMSLLLAACATQAAPPNGKVQPGNRGTSGSSLDIRIDAGISIGDARQLARQYGLAGAKPLPPGIAKNLARGKPLPPGIQKTRMPDGFVQALPQHPGYEWRIAGPDLVLVVSGTLVISDILKGVFD